MKSLLEGTAQEAISGLTLTSTNYKDAITILKKRFGNKQQIISKHMDILVNVEPVTSQYHLKTLHHLYDIVESNIRSLGSLGISSDSYGSILASVLIQKLPQDPWKYPEGTFWRAEGAWSEVGCCHRSYCLQSH